MKPKKTYHTLLFLIPAMRAERLQGHSIEYLAAQIKNYYLDKLLIEDYSI